MYIVHRRHPTSVKRLSWIRDLSSRYNTDVYGASISQHLRRADSEM